MEQAPYDTLVDSVQSELVINKSRFIGYAQPVQTVLEATQFIERIAKENWDATHNCYAYRIHPHQQKCSDDGEPSGTAGRPILETLQNKQLQYVAIVITRYFGGIKLGSGGLIRAYRQATLDTIHQAKIVTKSLHQQLLLELDYAHIGKLEHQFHASGLPWQPLHFGATISLEIWVPIDEVSFWRTQCNQLTQGQITIQEGIRSFR